MSEEVKKGVTYKLYKMSRQKLRSKKLIRDRSLIMGGEAAGEKFQIF